MTNIQADEIKEIEMFGLKMLYIKNPHFNTIPNEEKVHAIKELHNNLVNSEPYLLPMTCTWEFNKEEDVQKD